jgi:transposase
MPTKSKITYDITLDEIRKYMKATENFWELKKWLVVFNFKREPGIAHKLAAKLDVSESFVQKTVSKFNKFGIDSIKSKKQGMRNASYLTLIEEKKLLEKFIPKAEKARITTINEIKLIFEKKVGKVVNISTIYDLLKRHNWTKKMARSYHPKKNKEKQETFKKTLIMKLMK